MRGPFVKVGYARVLALLPFKKRKTKRGIIEILRIIGLQITKYRHTTSYVEFDQFHFDGRNESPSCRFSRCLAYTMRR